MLRLIYYYTAKDQDETEKIIRLQKLCNSYSIPFLPLSIDENEPFKKYQKFTPVISIGPYLLKSPFDERDIEVALKSAIDKENAKVNVNGKTTKSHLKENQILNRFGLIFANYYPLVISLILFLFVSISFLAPILEESGATSQANRIYRFYRVFCHQLAFRSFFIFGEQGFYPRSLAAISDVTSYEEEFKFSSTDLESARNLIGDAESGYKIALCERDLAIYGSLAIFALIFQFTRKRIFALRWQFWFLIALFPIALDGFTQIPGLSTGWPIWVPIRESTPFLRIFTGILFGAGTGWYMFPLMEESAADSRNIFAQKQEFINAEGLKKSENEKH
jgi:uncharacterized membrane protein